MKKFMAVILTLIFVLGALSIPAMADDGSAASGEWGSLTWDLAADGSLTISGAGEMSGFIVSEDAWREYSDSIKSVVLTEGVTSVSNSAFDGCASLASVSLPESVTSIGPHAFAGCVSLESVQLPAGLTSIGWGAFYGCNALTEINIPEGVKSIGDQTFFECTALESVTVPAGITSLGVGAFYGCTALSLVYVKSPDAAATLTEEAEMLEYAETVILSDGITATDYVKENYTDTGSAVIDGESVNWYMKTEECNAHYYEDGVCVICGDVLGGETSEEPSEAFVLGDANGDGAVNNIDASLVLQYDAGVAALDSTALAAADVNADNAVNNIDASRILQLDAGVIGGF